MPRMPNAPHPRVLYAAPTLHEAMEGPWSDEAVEYRMGKLRADLDHFSTGRLITVSSGSEKHAYMKLLDDADEEVWEIRSRDPKPSLRVFGRFADTDVFVATHFHDRVSLGEPGSRAWRDEFVRCKAEWRKLFPTYEPKRGLSINDYISENVVPLRSLR